LLPALVFVHDTDYWGYLLAVLSLEQGLTV